jgi:hypothetical protein
MLYINWLAVIIATICGYSLGAVWYSSMLFGKKWKEELQPTAEIPATGHPQKTYIITIIMTFVYCYMLAKIMILTDFSGMGDGMKMGFMTGLCFAAMAVGVLYQFSNRSTKMYLIDAGYLIASSTLMGIVLGAM